MDKAVILARGLGSRMRQADAAARLSEDQRAAASAGVKAMIPVGRPFLDYVLAALADAGYRRVCLVIGPEHDRIRTYYGETLRPRRIAVSFAIQELPRGTADAVAAAAAFAGDDPFLVINSDNYYPAQALRALRWEENAAEAISSPESERGMDSITSTSTSTNCTSSLQPPASSLSIPHSAFRIPHSDIPQSAIRNPQLVMGLAAFDQEGLLRGSNIPAERIRRYAVLEADAAGWLRRVVEKPDEATLAALARPLRVSMNCWRFGPAIFEGCRAIGPSPRGELELADAVTWCLARGERFRVVDVSGPVLDLSSQGDIAAVTERLKGLEIEL